MNGIPGEGRCTNMHNCYLNNMDAVFIKQSIRENLTSVMGVGKYLLLASLVLFLYVVSTIRANAQLIENSIPVPTNIHPNQRPCIMPDNSVVFQVNAPNATKPQTDLGKSLYMILHKGFLNKYFL